MSRRKLTVSRGQLELGELFPDAPLLLIGRSPACDMVLRMSGIHSVHFLLEWAGDGEFNPETGIWVITEIKNPAEMNERVLAESTAGQGLVLGNKPVLLGGLTWKWTEESLARADLPGGTLIAQVREAAKSVSRDFLGPTSLEVIMLSPDGQAVLEVEHLRVRDLKHSKIMKAEPKLRIRWKNNALSVTWSDLKAQSLNSRSTEKPEQGKVIEPSDLLYIYGPDHSFYLRLVPRLSVEESPAELWHDPFFKFAAGSALAMVLLLVMVAQMELPPQKIEQSEKPRIATVEIKEVQTPPPEPPPPIVPPPPEPPPPEPAKPTPTIAKSEPKPQLAKRAPKPKRLAKVPKKAEAPAPTPAPVVTNVQSVGLLGSLKKTKASTVVSADSIVSENSAIDTASAGKEKILVASAPKGIVDMQKTRSLETPGQDALADASENVTLNDDVKIGSVSAAKNRFSGGAFTIESGNESGDGTIPSGFGESVKGGLNREAVGEVVLANMRKIRACYNTALMVSPKLKGRLLLKWKISSTGGVTSIQVLKSDFQQSPFESCVVSVLRATTYPTSTEPTVVLYPFVFRKT